MMQNKTLKTQRLSKNLLAWIIYTQQKDAAFQNRVHKQKIISILRVTEFTLQH